VSDRLAVARRAYLHTTQAANAAEIAAADKQWNLMP
jgi:hypothetical protein